MTHKDIIDYFQSLNANFTAFPEKSFFRMDLDEIMGGFKSGINFPAMVIESPEGDAEGSSLSSTAIGINFIFSIYQRPVQDDFASQNEMLDECERLGRKIIARMRYDARNPQHLIYNKFKVSSMKWIKEGPIFNEGLYGYQFSGRFEGDELPKVDAADWTDIDLTC